MTKYTAIIKNNKIITVFANSKEEAALLIGMHLRGRPGRRDLYEKWIKSGSEII